MAKDNVTAAVSSDVPTVARGIPEVEVNPSNELLDGENLDRKRDLIENEPVHVDASGTRLEHDDSSLIPPPASANLELRQRTEKLIGGMLSSIGKGEESPDSMLAALKEEKRGLEARAAGGDENAKRRVGQVDEQLKSRESAAADRKSAAESSSGSGSPAIPSVPAGRVPTPPNRTTS